MTDPLDLVVRNIRLRQWDVLRGAMPIDPGPHDARMSAAMTRGLAIVYDLSDSQPRVRDLMARVMSLAEQDPRLSFLQGIPNGPILSMMRATTLEQALFDRDTDDVAQIALLIGLFTLLLDGLLDEAPDLLEPARPWLDRLMTLEEHPGAFPEPLHPVTETLVWCGAEAVRRIPLLDGWSDPVVRQEFTRATVAAYQTELASLSCRITDRDAAAREQRARVVAKSSACIWAGALIPVLKHGWPSGIAPRHFENLARSIGEFGGWVDDIVDLADDLRADRWSMPLLELSALVALFHNGAGNADPRPILIEALYHPLTAGKLPAWGVQRLNRVRDALTTAGIEETAILPVLSDVAEASLLDGLVPA